MYIHNAFEFLFLTLFDVYIFLVIARFVLQIVRGDFYNPLSQVIVKATSPLLLPLRKVIPGFGRIDVASIVLLLLVVIVKLLLFLFLFRSGSFNAVGFIIFLLLSLGNSVVNFFMLVIFASAILSWIAMGGGYNPFFDILRQMSDPVIQPVRRFIPPLGMIDISPMVVILGLYFIKILFGLQGVP